MPSTYSPDLRIELIANGEKTGTWGTITNDNLGVVIEDAIAGYISVSITSANQALTANNGTADQARNMVVNLTTTTAANFNVYIPPASKLYVIRNSSIYQATIFCSTVIGNTTAAGTGAVIPAGAIFAVFSDGTNVVEATGSAVSGGTGQTSYTVGDILFASTTTALSKLADVATGNALISGGVGVAPSYGKIGLTTHVSGTLPVANGGTGVTASTGTGSVVLSTSPTLTSPALVTPALGTPASGNLANCTFPTLNQNTTGSAATVIGNATGSTFGFNSGYGSVATAFGCRVWACINGSSSPASLRGSGNVSTVSDGGTGVYTLNFATALPDNDYAANATAMGGLTNAGFAKMGLSNNSGNCTVYSGFSDSSVFTKADINPVSVSVFR